MKKFRDLDIKLSYHSADEHIPLEFFTTTFPYAKRIKLFLGYFSTNAIRAIAQSFARFILNGGSIEIVTNQYYSKEDAERLINDKTDIDNDRFIDITSDYAKLKSTLSETDQHFFDCLRFLKNKGRIKIVAVGYEGGQSHHKQVILFDENDVVSTYGSSNFTLAGLIYNGESFSVRRSWTSPEIKEDIDKQIKLFDEVFNKRNKNYKYLDPKTMLTVIEKVGEDKDLNSLIQSSYKVLKLNNHTKEKVEKIRQKIEEEDKELLKKALLSEAIEIKPPSFPDFNKDGQPDDPYPYQTEASEKWLSSGKTGLFEMATGTGKTLTAMLCLIKEFEENKLQKNIIVVPGKELVLQWEKEMRDCGFTSIYCYHSGNPRLNKELEAIRNLDGSDLPLNVIVTYNSFSSDKFRLLFKSNLKRYVVVFDEAHRMGAKGVMKAIDKIEFKKTIGLSATPFRDWDEQGSNDFVNNFFKSSEPIYSFPMEKAIKGIRLPDGTIKPFLCNYEYYPNFCCLKENEWEEYREWTKKIPIADKERTINEKAALMRQMVIDKAAGKIPVLLQVLEKLHQENNHPNTLVYCPKGKEPSDEELDNEEGGEEHSEDDKKVIENIEKEVAKKFGDDINAQRFVGETTSRQRKTLLREFQEENVEVLYAIKCLDEGVNVPSTRNAIFLASGKNKREYIQRRGRILRLHKGKKKANVYDIMVLPTAHQYKKEKKLAESLITGEFGRVIEFLEISISKEQAIATINKKLMELDLDYEKVKELIKKKEEEIEERKLKNEKRTNP